MLVVRYHLPSSRQDSLPFGRWLRRFAAGVVASVFVTLLIPAVGPLGAESASAQVASTPARGTPQLAPTGTTEQVRQLVQCGGTMYAVGRFTSISWNGTTYSRNNAFSFSATSPYTVSSWNPNVDGQVNTIALDPTCSVAYIGGSFTSVNGTPVQNIAAVSTATGAVLPGFGHSANAEVDTIASTGSHLLVGGLFTSINGSSAHKYMASLNPTTGADDGFINLDISGNYKYCSGTKCAAGNHTRIYNQQISHGGTLDLVEGDFTSVGGQSRQQIFMLNIGGTSATVTGWTSPEFDQHCYFTEPFYVRAGSWSPDDSTVYIGTTGFHPYNWNWSYPLTGLCDAAAAFPAAQTSVSHLWVNYTGCDSLYSTAADSGMAYFGGHERWSQNAYGCNFQGAGAYPAPGMEGLYPTTGHLYLNSTGTAGYYSRGRGLGADDMLLTTAGLWIASDNYNNTNQCGGVYGHAGICFLPYG
jgi:hypothetical protein